MSQLPLHCILLQCCEYYSQHHLFSTKVDWLSVSLVILLATNVMTSSKFLKSTVIISFSLVHFYCPHLFHLHSGLYLVSLIVGGWFYNWKSSIEKSPGLIQKQSTSSPVIPTSISSHLPLKVSWAPARGCFLRLVFFIRYHIQLITPRRESSPMFLIQTMNQLLYVRFKNLL